MEDTAVLDASATAALSRRRKQSRPRQLASSLDSDTSADNQPGAEVDADESLRCSSCQGTFSHVDDLVEHSARSCAGSCDADAGRSASGAEEDEQHVVCNEVDGSGMENTPAASASSMSRVMQDSVDHQAQLVDTAASDDFTTQPQLPPQSSCSAPASPSFGEDLDHDDDQPDDYALPAISSGVQSLASQFDRVYPGPPDLYGPPGTAGFPRDHVAGDLEGGASSPKTTASSSMKNVSQLIDNNVSPASKIAMLESVVYALHQQQMFQLELIEALRRQLATALAASASASMASRPGDDSSSSGGSATLDLTLPRSSDAPTVLEQGSSLSSLMRLSAGVDARSGCVDARRTPSLGAGVVHSSPTASPSSALADAMLDGHHDSAWQAELNKSRLTSASSSTLLFTPKHTQTPLCDLSLFKKGKPPNVTVMPMRPSSDNVVADVATAGEDSSAASIFKHRCRLCLKILGSDSALQIHMRSHTGERPYKCNICGNRFTTKGNLKVHFQRHLEQYPNARMNPDPVPEYLDHPDAGHGYSERQMAPPAHTVPTSAGKSMMTSFRHSTTPSSKPFVDQSPRSTSATDDPPSLTPARENFTGGVVKPPAGSESMKTESSLSQRRATDSVSSAETDTQFQSPLSALSSMSSALSAFAPQLRMTFPPPATPPMSTTPLPAPPGGPVLTPFNMDPAGHPALPPPVPASTDLDDEDLEQYMEIQQTDTARIEELVREATADSGGRPRDGSTPSDPNECVICHRVLSCRSALLMHYRTHTGERPYRCRLCGRTFTTKGNLKTHMAVHRGRISGLAAASGQHRCRICRREFVGSVALQQHIRSAHAPDVVAPASNGGSSFQFPASGSSPGSAAAATAAAAMMMMPGVNPLLPFFNFPPFYQAPPRNLLPGAVNSASGAGPMRSALHDNVVAGGGGELDLRKPSSHVDSDGSRDHATSRADINEQRNDGGPASKRVKTEDLDPSAAGSDVISRWQQNDTAMSRHLNSHSGSSSNEYSGLSPDSNNDDDDGSSYNEPTSRERPTAADSECSLSASKDLSTVNKPVSLFKDLLAIDVRRRDDARTSNNGQPPATIRAEEESLPLIAAADRDGNFADHVASKFASPLLALEERVNSLSDYSTNVFSRFNAAASAHRDVDDCDVDASDAAERDRSSSIQDVRLMDDSYHQHDDQQSASTSPSARRLMMSGQSDGEVGGASDDSVSSRHSASPGAQVRPGSSGSGASSSLSGGAVLPASDVVQSPSKMSASTPMRYSCSVCAKPFASASALEIHSRTHSGDRPFICHICSKAFTTKGNLKVHMSTHAWNKCPSRRGRRMTVVDPAAAAAVAAATSVFSGSMSSPKDAATAAATAAFLSSTFGAGVALPPPPPPIFGGFVSPPGVAAGNGAFLPDNKALLNYCMQAAAAHGGGREGVAASDALRQSMSTAGVSAGNWAAPGGVSGPWIGAFKDERNNNARTSGGGPALASQPRGGELDLSARSNGTSNVTASNFSDRQASSATGMHSWTSDRGSALPLISNCT